jgi:hypothetical protein
MNHLKILVMILFILPLIMAQGKTPLSVGEGKGMRLLKPNLFDGKLYANITLQAEEQGKLEIYNLQGVLIGNLQLMNGKNELDLSPMNLPNGVYLYRVWANDEIKHSDKLVKLK